MIHLVFDMLAAWRECLSNRKKGKPPRPDELFKGAPKPSTVLVEMIAADLVKNLPDPKIKTEEDFKVKVSRTQTITTDWYTLSKVDRQHLYDREIYTSWHLISPAVSLTSHEKTILEKAWEQMSQLKAARAAAEREAKNQNNALMAIEKRLKIDTQPVAEAA